MTPEALAVALCAACAATLLARPRAVPAPLRRPSRWPGGRRAGGGSPSVLVAVGVVGCAAGLVVLGPLRLALVAGLVTLVGAERGRSRRRARRLATAHRCEEYVMMLAAQMSAGRTPPDALAAAADAGVPGSARAARAASLGADAARALGDGSLREGAGCLNHVAAAWRLATTTGAPLADVLRRTSRLVRDEVATVREVEEQMAPVRATGRVLTLLPAMGVVIGGGLGVDVPVLLATTTWGQLCLLAALGLVSAGLWAIDRIGERAARP